MTLQINDYARTITRQVLNLLESDMRCLSESQRHAVELISVYAHDLYDTLYAADLTQQLGNYEHRRSQLIDTLTTIVGYAEMLADGWIGRLEQDQVVYLETLRTTVRELIFFIQTSYPAPSQAAIKAQSLAQYFN